MLSKEYIGLFVIKLFVVMSMVLSAVTVSPEKMNAIVLHTRAWIKVFIVTVICALYLYDAHSGIIVTALLLVVMLRGLEGSQRTPSSADAPLPQIAAPAAPPSKKNTDKLLCDSEFGITGKDTAAKLAPYDEEIRRLSTQEQIRDAQVGAISVSEQRKHTATYSVCHNT